MRLEISRDQNGHVTISNPATGKTETVATGVVGRPAAGAVAAAQDLPAHHWSRMA